MKRLAALAGVVCSLALFAAQVFAQAQPVPKWHSDPLYWFTARGVNTFPFYTQSVLHGMGVESDTLGIFTLSDAVPFPDYASSNALGTVSKSDTLVCLAKLRFESDTVTTGGAPPVTADTLIVQVFQGTWMPGLTTGTVPVTPARWKGTVCYTARVVMGADSSATAIEVPIPNHIMFGPANLTQTGNITSGNNAGAPQWVVTKPTFLPQAGNKFYAVVTTVGGTFPACKATIGYYRLE